MEKSTAIPTGTLIPQPHGGALRHGGPNKGGSGRPRSSIKAIAKKALRQRIGHLTAFADGVAVSLVEGDTPETQKLVTHAVKVETRVKALEVLAKIAGDNTVAMSEVRSRLKRQVEVIRATLPPEQADALLHALTAVWA